MDNKLVVRASPLSSQKNPQGMNKPITNEILISWKAMGSESEFGKKKKIVSHSV